MLYLQLLFVACHNLFAIFIYPTPTFIYPTPRLEFKFNLESCNRAGREIQFSIVFSSFRFWERGFGFEIHVTCYSVSVVASSVSSPECSFDTLSTKSNALNETCVPRQPTAATRALYIPFPQKWVVYIHSTRVAAVSHLVEG